MPAAPREAIRRFECPGDLVQIGTKRFRALHPTRPQGDRRSPPHRRREAHVRRVGVLSLVIDDHSQLAYTEIHGDEKAPTVTAFIERALAFFAAHGITAKRIQTDNAFSCVHNRSLRDLLIDRGIEHRRIPPRTPKRNGKVERYQQTLAREWAYGQRYRNSDC
jgi:transposase InsO family protein